MRSARPRSRLPREHRDSRIGSRSRPRARGPGCQEQRPIRYVVVSRDDREGGATKRKAWQTSRP